MRGRESKTGKDEKPIQDCLTEELVAAMGICVCPVPQDHLYESSSARKWKHLSIDISAPLV